MSTEKRKYELKARARTQAETRERIVAATRELHEEVGPARTTVAEVARRAGVQRLTVYNHFPEDGDLFAACQHHFLSEHPPPDPGPALAMTNPEDGLRTVLEAFYGWYRATAPMSGAVRRDRGLVPALDALMADTVDPWLAELADGLSAPFDHERSRALVALALEFATWQTLTAAGLGDPEAASTMADAVARAAQ